MSNTFFQGAEKNFGGDSPPHALPWSRAWGKVVTARTRTRLAQLRSSLLCLQRQVAKLTSGLFYSWSLLRNNNTAINLQMFTLSHSSLRFTACDQGSHCFFHPDLFFSRSVFLGYCEKSRGTCVFWSDKLISISNVFNNINLTLHYDSDTEFQCS